MVDAQRALLDELMGTARNLTDEEKKGFREIRWDDKEVCGCYLIRFCPHDLFVNTKSNLGPCAKIHDPKLKESFEKSSRHDLYAPRLESELAEFCQRLVQDLDRKLRRGRERIAQDQDAPPMLPLSAEKSEQLATLEEKMKNLLEQIESLGEEGKVDEAQALMKKVEVLTAEKNALLQQLMLASSQEKKMALCEICGSFLVANDVAERTQSHVTGKQHLGYSMVRDYLAEYREKQDKEKEEEKLANEKRSEERRKRERVSERTRGNGREDFRERGRERDVYYHGAIERDYKHHGRARYADHNGGRERGHDRDRRERDYSRTRSRTGSDSRSPSRHRSRRYSGSPDRMI
ncbi:hypothetical protein KP509_09G061200 [Ceratopteris richardii]|uniref:Luc7-like protein 3 n=1 Tax=Ceratopteris richardii TaxID=49495 RepID=A0A8T2UB04_CERRI|nr:hypothetical protein KP509_09G061200 [Ceratopteris richardii]